MISTADWNHNNLKNNSASSFGHVHDPRAYPPEVYSPELPETTSSLPSQPEVVPTQNYEKIYSYANLPSDKEVALDTEKELVQQTKPGRRLRWGGIALIVIVIIATIGGIVGGTLQYKSTKPSTSALPLTQTPIISTSATVSPTVSSSIHLVANGETLSTTTTRQALLVSTTRATSIGGETSTLSTPTSSLSKKPTNQPHLPATVLFCKQLNCQGSCFNQTVVGDGKCHQLGHISAAITQGLDSNCSVTVYTDSTCSDSATTAGLENCTFHSPSLNSFSYDC